MQTPLLIITSPAGYKEETDHAQAKNQGLPDSLKNLQMLLRGIQKPF